MLISAKNKYGKSIFKRDPVPLTYDYHCRTRYSEKLEFCDPIEVAVGMIATLQFRYIEIFAAKSVELFTSLTGELIVYSCLWVW